MHEKLFSIQIFQYFRQIPPGGVHFRACHYYNYLFIYIFQAERRARAVNALRVNVGPAG